MTIRTSIFVTAFILAAATPAMAQVYQACVVIDTSQCTNAVIERPVVIAENYFHARAWWERVRKLTRPIEPVAVNTAPKPKPCKRRGRTRNAKGICGRWK